MLKEINHSFIVLIPKGNNVVSVNQYKPISLCNVLYKTISKIFANKLKQILHKLISLWQIAFIPGRKIQEDLFLAQEILHATKNKKGKMSWMALKNRYGKGLRQIGMGIFGKSLTMFWIS